MIVYGLDESHEEQPGDLRAGVDAIMENLNEKPAILNISRVGKTTEDKYNIRPIKISLHSADMVQQLLRKSSLLKDVGGYGEIYLSPDRSPQERATYKKLREQLMCKSKEEPNKVHYIRNNRLVSRDKRDDEC